MNIPTIMQNEKKKRVFKKYLYRGHEVSSLIDLTRQELVDLFRSRIRRRMNRGLMRPYRDFLAKVTSSIKKQSSDSGTKQVIVKTHLRDMIILPEMIGAQLGVYNGKGFVLVEVKPGMIGKYLAEYSITYKPVKHGHISKNFHGRFMQLV